MRRKQPSEPSACIASSFAICSGPPVHRDARRTLAQDTHSRRSLRRTRPRDRPFREQTCFPFARARRAEAEDGAREEIVLHCEAHLPPTTVSIYVSLRTRNYGTFHVRFGQSMVPTTRTSLNQSQTPTSIQNRYCAVKRTPKPLSPRVVNNRCARKNLAGLVFMSVKRRWPALTRRRLRTARPRVPQSFCV